MVEAGHRRKQKGCTEEAVLRRLDCTRAEGLLLRHHLRLRQRKPQPFASWTDPLPSSSSSFCQTQSNSLISPTSKKKVDEITMSGRLIRTKHLTAYRGFLG